MRWNAWQATENFTITLLKYWNFIFFKNLCKEVLLLCKKNEKVSDTLDFFFKKLYHFFKRA